jgi:hypothetical protein
MGNLTAAHKLLVLVVCAQVATVHTYSIGAALNWALGNKHDSAETDILSLERIHGRDSAATPLRCVGSSHASFAHSQW